VCKSLVADVWNPRVDRKSDIAGRVRGEHGDFALGYVNTTLAVRDGMPVLVYEGGSKCPKTDFMYGSAVIRFICDKDVYGAGTRACWLGCAEI
jgi:cation-dependent mannose-6-phosphate receptor